MSVFTTTPIDGHLGMHRLSILDLEHGRQPMASQTGPCGSSITVRFFNSPELRGRLEQRQPSICHGTFRYGNAPPAYDDKQEGMLGT